MIILDNRKRTTIPSILFHDIQVPPSDNVYRLYFAERSNSIVFSIARRKESFVQIGQLRVDDKHRLYFQDSIIELAEQLLGVSFSQMYFCLNQKGELCIKKVPN